eukprot:CAMPEP_0175225048 /NCGR_PEP_ID=MMETSP0093-20121207/22170_1 /TAXON_ID=311494 /ORGANISM="Alexandrium monilatum, Strain CCMP3105" /LENGTH=76 /DNA_ID=CAMNT_0016518717 /DNA_START=52 /DNA_END=282 /DNA_ORIENTATION=-
MVAEGWLPPPAVLMPRASRSAIAEPRPLLPRLAISGDGGLLGVEALAASALGLLVGVVEDELGAHAVAHKVHLSAN